MPYTRYRYEDELLTPEQAAERKRLAVDGAQFEVDRLELLVQEAREHLENVKDSPPPTVFRRQVAVEPGEPGYEDLPAVFDPVDYQGDIRWINIQPGKQTETINQP